MDYTGVGLDNSTSAANRILFCIKTKGPISTSVLASTLEMTPEAARQQVQKLMAFGLIEGHQEASAGVGRPKQSWVLTDAGNQRFPDTHAHLTVQLIGSIRTVLGENALDQLIAQREVETRATYLQSCIGKSLRERLNRLAEMRWKEGYMARVERDGKDWLLIEDHCPICAAASICQGFCRSELRLFQEIVGPDATVTREKYIQAGDTRCVYRISSKSIAPTA